VSSFRFKYSPYSILFSNSLNPFSSLRVRDQVSNTYKTTGKNYTFYIHDYIFLRDGRQ
jgi:hypothetical protein